jgi:5-(carboxyamino)imidazole ribonucleotide mutase
MAKATANRPLVGLIMGSASDAPTLREAGKILGELGIAFEMKVISAHRTPQRAHDYLTTASGRGLKVIIAAAGMAAHLAGVSAALTHLPVLGVPMEGKLMGGLDALLSTVQMPRGVPVATFGIGSHGAANAALFAAAILALSDPAVEKKLLAYRKKQTDAVPLEPPAGT